MLKKAFLQVLVLHFYGSGLKTPFLLENFILSSSFASTLENQYSYPRDDGWK